MQGSYAVQIYKPGSGSPMQVTVEARNTYQAKEIAEGMYRGYKATTARKV